MVRRMLREALLLVLVLATAAIDSATAAAAPQVAVVTGPAVNELERYAAEQLCVYLDRLYGVKTGPTATCPSSAEIVFLVGSPAGNPLVRQSAGIGGWPNVSDQGIVLKRATLDGKPALVVGGGSVTPPPQNRSRRWIWLSVPRAL